VRHTLKHLVRASRARCDSIARPPYPSARERAEQSSASGAPPRGQRADKLRVNFRMKPRTLRREAPLQLQICVGR